MKGLSKTLACLFVYFTLGLGTSLANTTNNQTDDLSTILPGAQLPFQVQIALAGFQLPAGIHSGVIGVYNGLWILMAGRTNGLHGFGADPFPPAFQNTDVYVVNPATGSVKSRSIKDRSSGLTQHQIDTLSVTSPQSYQEGNTLFMTGGYGLDTSTNTYITQPVLTAINLPGIVKWVTEPNNKNYTVVKNIKQLTNPIFQITGGKMYKIGDLTQLVFGQNFTGVYTPSSNGTYSEQVRRFQILIIGNQLTVKILKSFPQNPDPNYRRRDLNVVPTILDYTSVPIYGLIAYSGVFTEAGGVWTVPVVINNKGIPAMSDPHLPSTFKQGMNNYTSANVGLYSKQNMNMYHIFFGGISYGFYSGGSFQTDSEDPFINQVTTVQMDKNGRFTQYLMDNQYPTIASTGSNPGNTLLFGAGARFMPADVPKYPNNVISLDAITKPTVIGYIVGGIASTVANTSVDSDSTASPYIFTVTLVPNH